MAPEREYDEQPFEVRLESCLLHGPVDDVVDLLRGSDKRENLDAGNALDRIMQTARNGFDFSRQADIALCIEDPKVLARCLYELERLNELQGAQLLGQVEQSLEAANVVELHSFLARLREGGNDGGDGGAGDREPLTPIDPTDGGAAALEPPREKDVDAVARPATAHI